MPPRALFELQARASDHKEHISWTEQDLALGRALSMAMVYDCTWGLVFQVLAALPLKGVPSQLTTGPTSLVTPSRWDVSSLCQATRACAEAGKRHAGWQAVLRAACCCVL